MTRGRFLWAALSALLISSGAPATAAADEAASAVTPVAVDKDTKDAACLDCHGVKGFAVPAGEFGEGPSRSLAVDADILRASVHAKERCVACHSDIEQTPHKPDKVRTVNCVQCHEELPQPGDAVQTEVAKTRTMLGLPVDLPKPSKLAREAGHYLDSIHAKKRKGDPARPNATCWDCHGKHNVFPMASKQAQTYRLSTPRICGACHEKALREYTNSVHGAAVKRRGNLDMAVCSDCHSAHKIASPKDDPVKLAITENCGSCHEAEVKTYRATYHGQVARLGYAHTAKCHDCHEAHNTLPSDDPRAMTHVGNRLKACKECHKHASAGFISFEPHGNTHDYARFPTLWIASKFMIALLAGVFLFFWSHSLLWFYRERKEREQGKVAVRVDANGDAVAQQYVRRFTWQWRLAHLALALAVMILVLTGTTVLYADSFWAPTVMKLLGGPKVAGAIHRVAATVFGLIFFGHIAVLVYRARKQKDFQWFGPDSLMPRRQDLHDFAAMVRWFLGKGPRPVFDRWTYWEKFDYWAPFWGMFVIGLSGLMLWLPTLFGAFLPGWVFNVATIVHGEEAFLAAVFLFTVHFFNSHFRPEKFPVDVVMFTGSMPLAEFKEERRLEYERLVKDGTLEQYLVGAPSARMARRSRTLGLALIGIGLALLGLVLLGFLQSLLG